MNATYPSHDSDSASRWMWAITGALLWHVLVLGGFSLLRPFGPGESRAVPPQPVELVFSPAEPAPEPVPASEDGQEDPSFFSELPPDRADLAPSDPDFLSNVTSRARDRATGSSLTDLPRMEGQSEAPHVEMEPTPGALVEPSEGEPTESPELPLDRPDEGAAAEDLGRAELGQDAQPQHETGSPDGSERRGASSREGDPREDLLRPPAPTRLEDPRYLIGVGAQDLRQMEMNNRAGNVSLFGDVSLNTIAWEWAPWLQRFSRDFHRNWLPPYAYRIGVIDGRQVIDLEVAPDGRMVKLDVVSQEGHQSLTESSLATFRAIAPLQPLPEDFPEETLQIRITIVYPSFR